MYTLKHTHTYICTHPHIRTRTHVNTDTDIHDTPTYEQITIYVLDFNKITPKKKTNEKYKNKVHKVKNKNSENQKPNLRNARENSGHDAATFSPTRHKSPQVSTSHTTSHHRYSPLLSAEVKRPGASEPLRQIPRAQRTLTMHRQS